MTIREKMDVAAELIVEIWPSGTCFEAGSELILEIAGHDADRYPAPSHKATVNRGTHIIHTARPRRHWFSGRSVRSRGFDWAG